MKVAQRDPRDLRPHPVIESFPRWSRDSDEWAGFVADIEARGIQEPLWICDDLVIDGETRRQAALLLGMKSVPVREVDPDEVCTTAFAHLQLRRNLTKGQRAYLSVPFLEHLAIEGEKIRRKNLKNGQKPQQIPEPALSAASGNLGWISSTHGFGVRLLEQARQLHRLFDNSPAIRAEWEARIFDPEDPIGLGAAIAGIAGQQATDGQERQVRPQEQLWIQGFRTFVLRTARIEDVTTLKRGIRDLVDTVDDADALDRLRRVAVAMESAVKTRQGHLTKEGV